MTFGVLGAPVPDMKLMQIAGKELYKIRGVKFSTIDDTLRSSLVLSDNKGLYVYKISKLSKFYKLGLRKNDVILEVNSESENLLEILKTNIAKLKVYRDNKEVTLK